jgi:hypothetical protein
MVELDTKICLRVGLQYDLLSLFDVLVAEEEVMDVSARKSQKAGREKLRREKLNEHFVELGNVLGIDSMVMWIFLNSR